MAHNQNERTLVFKKIGEVCSGKAHPMYLPLFTFLLGVFSISYQQFYARDIGIQTLPRFWAFGQNLRLHFIFKYVYFQFEESS